MIAQISGAERQQISYEMMNALAGRIADHAVDIAKKIGVTKVTSQIEDGDTANRILKMAKKADADLIVLGTHGFGPLKAMLLGSKSQKVTQLAKCSCLTVK